jgi:hypothetical protein
LNPENPEIQSAHKAGRVAEGDELLMLAELGEARGVYAASPPAR